MDPGVVENVYKFISDFIGQNGFSPSIREIAKGCYISTTYVLRCLDLLESQGRLTREPGKARSIRLLDPNNDAKQMF